jgi:hypothetical protein
MNRTDILHFKVCSPERAAAEALAKFESVKLSEVLRLALREAATKRGLWPAAAVERPADGHSSAQAL